MSDRGRLKTLRLSVARLAQAMGVQTRDLPVIDMEDHELFHIIGDEELGWNDLCSKMKERYNFISSNVDLREVLGNDY